MIKREDIERVDSLPIEQVADALGMSIRRHTSLCPYHEDTRPSLHFRPSSNKFNCFACNSHGGCIDLAMKMLGTGFHDAVCWLAQKFGITIDEAPHRDFGRIETRRIEPVNRDPPNAPDPNMLAQIVAQPTLTAEARRFLFDERRIDPRVARWCQLSSTHRHLLIPYFDIGGRLQSVQWRYLGSDPEEPRFRFPRGSRCHIYNMQILKRLAPGEPLYVCEGCSDCWAMLSSGRKAIAIPSATLLRPDDTKPLKGVYLRMYPDNDAPGEKLYQQLRQLFPHLEKHQLPEGCKDFAEAWARECQTAKCEIIKTEQ